MPNNIEAIESAKKKKNTRFCDVGASEYLMSKPSIRPRRLRKNPLIRELTAETHLSQDSFVYPYFVIPGTKEKQPVNSMDGIFRFSIDTLLQDVERGLKYGVNKLMLFGTPSKKDEEASEAIHPLAVIPEAIRQLKKAFGDDIYLMSDLCLCAYTHHGHCGLLCKEVVDNDTTLSVLGKMALVHAEAGVDMVAPSDMMDMRVRHIRETLDGSGFFDIAIFSYAAKFASNYYGPFREAAHSGVVKGDRKSYQLDMRNKKEALREILLDEAEGADLLMVKPALAYLDIIHQAEAISSLPIGCYNVSGEYAMVVNAAKAGLIDERAIVLENFYAFKRAGASIVISYHTRKALEEYWFD